MPSTPDASRYSSSLPSMILAALSFASMTFFVKLSASGLGIFEVVVVRSVVTCAIAYGVVRHLKVSLWGTHKVLLIIRGICGFSAMLCLYTAVQRLPLADANVIQYTNPVFTAVLGAIVLKERFGRTEVVAMTTSLAGVLLIARPASLFGDTLATIDPVAVGIGLLGALFSAGSYVTIRKMKGQEDPNLIIFYFPLVCFVGSIPIGMTIDWTTPTLTQWAYMVLGVSISAHLGQVFLTRGLHGEKAARAMAMSYLQIVFAAILAAAFLNEKPSLFTIVGGILVMSGTYVAARTSDVGVGDE